jgi:hypothetical protein
MTPAHVTKDSLLCHLAGERLNRSASVLVLSGIDDRPRAQFLEHPVHFVKLGRGHSEREPGFADQRLHTEFTPLLLTIVKYKVSYDARTEVADGCGFQAAITLHLLTHNLVLMLRIPRLRAIGMPERTTTDWPWHNRRIIIGPDPNQSKVHKR